MRPSTTLLSSAAAAAIVSLFGLSYAERTGHVTRLETDAVQLQPQARDDTPTGTLQTADAPTAPVAPGATDTASMSSTNEPLADSTPPRATGRAGGPG